MKTTAVYPIFMAAALLGAVSCHSKKENASEGEMPVSVAVPKIDSVVLHKQYPGFLISDRDAGVVARVNGLITAKHYNNGDFVQSGAPLFSIESTTYEAALHEAESRLETALANNEYCKKQYEAMTKALESDAVSKMDVVQARSNLDQSEAAIKSARAAVTDARTNLGYCTVRAPLSGRASAASVVVGDYVAGGMSPVKLLTIYDDRIVEAVFTVEDTHYLEMTETRKGKEVDYDHVRVNFGDSVVRPYYGKLSYEAPAVQKSTGTIELRVEINNPDGELKNGMYCTVDLPYAVDPHAMLIKDAAIGTDQLGKYVYVVNDSDKVVYTPITVGDVYRDSMRIVNSGLSPDSRYVTRALLKVRDGMKVKPQMPGETARSK